MGTAIRQEEARARPASWSETELIAGARDGDGAAFEAIMRRNNRRLFRTARAILKNEAEAEEVVQETYLKAYAGLARFGGRASLSTWLVRIAVNEALARLRRRMPTEALDSLTDGKMNDETSFAPMAGPRPDDPEAVAARGEIRGLLEGAIDGLAQAQRAVFVLRALEEFSVADTALCLGIPEATVKTRYHRAKRQLRQALNERLHSALADTFPFAGARCDRIVAGVLQRLGLASHVTAAGPEPPG